MKIQRIGVMTGGGDCPGLNAVLRAVVRTATRQYGWQVLGIEDAFNGLIDLDYRGPNGNRWLDQDSVEDLIRRGGTFIGTSNRSDPFRFPVQRDGNLVEEDVFDKVLENYKQLGLDALISVGGDGSMGIASKAIARGMTNIVGVPKTIDNDLGSTDTTFGFDTAVNVATEAIDRLRDTAESHDRVMLVEVMGRNAGWIALHAGLAGGAHAILIPEIPYQLEPIAAKIRERRVTGHPYSIVVVAEGARPLAGVESLFGKREVGAMDRLFGAAARVAEGLHAMIKLELRYTVLGHLQRGGSPTAFDRILGSRYGEQAVHLIARGQFGHMVSLRNGEILSVPIADAVTEPKRVTPTDPLVQTARSLGVVFGDEEIKRADYPSLSPK
ncbi:MAG: ATP-dependent 6-phosphofructokinase [Polyangiaceae bacterium]